MKRILVPYDFSRQSREAFTVALKLAAKSKGEVLLLHVIATPPLYTGDYGGGAIPFDATYFGQMVEDASRELQKMKMQAKKEISISTEAVFGDLVTTVLNKIEENKIDQVVMGTSGSSGITEFFIGSNTEKIVRFSPVPVLAIKTQFDPDAVRNILVPSTLDLNQTNFIDKLKTLQKFFHATLHILLINTPIHFRRDAEATEALEEFAKHYKVTDYKLHFSNYPREDDGIAEFANAQNMDLVAMATHARKGLSHLFNTSVTESVVNHLQAPIWSQCIKN
jgi:nucleotide-binding universal stress UspA family protein